MADTKISGLSAVAAVAATDEFAVNQGGVSKKATAAQVKTYLAPALPTIVAVTAEFTGTGVPTATLPTGHTTDDILVLVIQSSNQVITAPASYTKLGPQNGLNTAAAAGANRLGIFWKRDNGSEVAPTIPDTGDHTYGFMFAIRGCPTSGDPFFFGGNNWKFTASTTGTSPASATYVDNCLVVDIFAGNVDNASAEGSSPTNADLGSVTEQFDDGTTDGTGGFLYMMSGTKVTAGPVGASTVTWANSSSDLCSRIHFLPSGTTQNQIASRGPEVQSFIGSPAAIDDTWVKPTGARKVFAQLCDAGGSGSSGNTATTAAGGGGGGGGGYDEAWFNADELGATVTIQTGKGGDATTGLNQPGNGGTLSIFDKGSRGPLTANSRVAGSGATAAASANGGDGGNGAGRGLIAPSVATTRIELTAATAGAALGGVGGRGGSGTTSPVGGSPADWGGGGGESGADTDAGTTSNNNGYSVRGGGGGAGGRTNTNISVGGSGGGAGPGAAQGSNGADSSKLPYGGAGGNGGGSSVAAGGNGGFPGGAGGGGGGVAGGNGGRGGDGMVMVTTFF